MASKSIVITGIKEIDRALKKLDAVDAKKAIRKGVRAGLDAVLSSAKEKSPVKSGRLKKSLKKRALKRKKGRIGYKIVAQPTKKEAEANPDQYFYGAAVEFGTEKTPENDFMLRAFEEKKAEAEAIAIAEIKAQIKNFLK